MQGGCHGAGSSERPGRDRPTREPRGPGHAEPQAGERGGHRSRLGRDGRVLFSPRGHDASQITLALGTAASYPRACQALGAMLSKGALNPADITVLFKMFTSMDPPPVELVSRFSRDGSTGHCPCRSVGLRLGGLPSSRAPSWSVSAASC